jgi:hypothetical protein
MKRLALSISAAAALWLGACEKHSSAELPEHYQNRWSPKSAETGHEPAAPAHGEKEKAPAAEHKG